MKCTLKYVAKTGLFVIAIAVFSAIVMLLWNWVMPVLFSGAHSIDYAHAFGLLVLCRILFGGFHRHGGGRHRWSRMSREQREAFRRGMRMAHDHEAQ